MPESLWLISRQVHPSCHAQAPINLQLVNTEPTAVLGEAICSQPQCLVPEVSGKELRLAGSVRKCKAAS